MKSRKDKELMGTSRPDREVQLSAPPDQKLVPEKWLNKAMKDNFKAVKKLYEDANVPYFTVDSKILSLWCFWMAVVQFYTEKVAEDMSNGDYMALLVEYESSTQVNAYYTIINKATDQLVKMSKLIGITPYSRGKIAAFLNAVKNMEDPQDEF